MSDSDAYYYEQQAKKFLGGWGTPATAGEQGIIYALLAILETMKPQPVRVQVSVNADQVTAAVQEALK